jgi:uncharacterized protein (DUF58 family)
VPARITIEVENLSSRRLEVTLAEHISENMTISPPCLKTILPARQRVTLEYRLTICTRGRFVLKRFDVRLLPAMGVLYRQFTVEQPAELHVFPNLVNIERHKLLLRQGVSQEQGWARLHGIGVGSEFENLRHYVLGDDVSKIDWKASAKKDALVVKNYEPERRQSVVVLLDVGRATSGEFEGLSRVDYLINAALMLAHVTLRQKDHFSFMAFSDRIESYLPPIQGTANIERVAQALYHLQPRLVESDYDLACRFITQKHRKRSLFCMMTDVLDSQASGILLSHMNHIRKHHLPLLVALDNPEISRLCQAPLRDTESLHTKAVAIDVTMARQEALARMRHRGISILDVVPGRLTTELINRYVQIKYRRLL